MNRAFALLLLWLFSFGRADAETISDRPEFIVKSVLQASRCTFPSFSPNDKKIAFVSNMAGHPNIWVVDAKGGWPHQITALDDDVIGLDWSPSFDQIAFLAGSGKRKIYTVTSDGTILKSWSKEDANDNMIRWSPDGKSILIEHAVGSKKSFLGLLSPLENKIEDLAESDGQSIICDITKDKQTGLLLVWNKTDDTDLFLVDLKSGKRTLLTPHKEQTEFFGGGIDRSVPQFSDDEKAIYLAVNNRLSSGFARIKIEQGKPQPLELLVSGKLSGFVFDQERDQALLCFSQNQSDVILLWNKSEDKITSIGKNPGKSVRGFAFSHDGSKVALQISNWFGQQDIWILNLETKNFEQITFASHAGFNSKDLPPPIFDKFHSPGAEEVSCTIYKPANHTNERIPYVLNFGTNDLETVALAMNGVGVMRPSFASIESRIFDDSFYKSWTTQEGRKRAITTIQDCIDFLVLNHGAQTGKIGVMGHSYNGYMTFVAITELPELFKAAAIQGGISDMRLFFKLNNHAQGKLFDVYAKNLSAQEKEKQLDLLSPVKKQQNIKAAVLIEHGVKDTQCPVQDADQMNALLKKRGANVQYLRLEKEGHGFFSKQARFEVSTKLVEFFVKQLKQ